MKKLIGRIEPVMHLQGHLDSVPGGVYAPEDETVVSYIVRALDGTEIPSDLVEEESTASLKIIQILEMIPSLTDEERLEIMAEVDALLNETDPNELANLAGHSIVNKIRLAQTYRDDVISAIEAKGISAAGKQPFRTVADLVEQITRQSKTVTPSTEEQIVVPDEGVYGLESVTVEGVQLQELNVWATEEVQEFYPDEGYLGFSKVIVDAADFGGGDGGGDIVIDGGAAEDTTFGDDWFNVPTGNYDYSAGADAEPSYIPEIPGEGYKALFSKQAKKCSYIKFTKGTTNGKPNYIEIQSDDGEFYIYATWGRAEEPGSSYGGGTLYSIYMYSDSFLNYKVRENGGIWSAKYPTGKRPDLPGYSGWGSSGTISALLDELPDYCTPTGIPLFNLGYFSGGTWQENSAAFNAAGYALATSDDTEMGDEQFIAFVSSTQILYDGSVINNMDKSPMTIYECNAGDKNTWSEVGTTDGTDYPVGAYTLVWNSHDLLDTTGQYVTHSKSDDPIAEMSEGDIGIPVERNETYFIEGETVNTLVGAAQKVTGGKTPLTPTDAALALDEYYNHPAEEGKW